MGTPLHSQKSSSYAKGMVVGSIYKPEVQSTDLLSIG
jgi:hypothetical protein